MPIIWTPQPLDVYRQWISDIETEASDRLTPWETSFIANITMKLDNLFQLTEEQANKLEQIYVKYTS